MSFMKGSISIRPIMVADELFLWEALYLAIYTPPGKLPPPREIVHSPELSRYVAGWGQVGDIGFIAEENGQPIGTIWLRLFDGGRRGYGYVDDDIPELSMAVLPENRARGIGSGLLAHLLDVAACRFQAVSLSVARNNPARRLYERYGFKKVGESADSLTMLRHFSEPPAHEPRTSE